MAVSLFTGCGKKNNAETGESDSNKLSVVTTIFPEYDWVREILGGKAESTDLTMLLDNGVDLHSYQPTADDIVKISDCDLFISAAQKQMNQLDASKDTNANPDKLDFVKDGSRVDLLENKVVLVTPEGNPKGIQNFADMAGKLKDGSIRLVMGNSDVPVGQYTQKILKFFNLDEQAIAQAGHITYGSNVKEVTTQVREGSADCGVIYATDAFSAKLKPVDEATKAMCGQVIYPAAVMKNSKHPQEAQAFLDYLKGQEAMTVFQRVGFSPVG